MPCTSELLFAVCGSQCGYNFNHNAVENLIGFKEDVNISRFHCLDETERNWQVSSIKHVKTVCKIDQPLLCLAVSSALGSTTGFRGKCVQ